MNDANSRIAKNTLLLYLRFFLTMLVSLYTSRIILQNLGVVNFGLYNVISGVITVFAMLNLSLSSQRFISYELGLGNYDKVKQIVKNFNGINFIICAVILLLAETVGLWFLHNKMVIPDDRMTASIIAYQCTIVSFLSLIYVSTYVSTVISYEKMSAFAFISIIEVVGKLLVAIVLPLFPSGDPLIIYSIMLMIIQVLINLSYIVYCKTKIEGIPIGVSFNKKVVKDISGFALLLNITGVFVWLSQQGLNVLLNLFCGPIVNAARGIGMQVMGAVENFSYSFLKAVAPQITKTYASNEDERLKNLFLFSSKYSFLLVFFISFPIILNTELILHLWLGDNVPDYTAIFVRLTLIWISISILSQPCMYVVQASGNIKNYQLFDMIGCGLVFVLSYVLLKLGTICWCVYIVSIIIEILLLSVRLYIVSKRTIITPWIYFKVVVTRLLGIGIPTILILALITKWYESSFLFILLCYFIEAVTMTTLIYLLGTSEEKRYIKKLVHYGKK